MNSRRSAAAMFVGLVLASCAAGPMTDDASPEPETANASTDTGVVIRTHTGSTTTNAAPVVDEPEPMSVPVADTAPMAPPDGAPPETGSTVWPPYLALPGTDGVAALTGLAADAGTTSLPALAVKIDNQRDARPQWGLEAADVVIEENVEGVTRFVAVFHSRRPEPIGPVRSARSGDLALLAAFNRPILGWSGGNPGVTRAVQAAADAGVLVDLSALRQGGCYRRAAEKRKPHNLVLDPTCAWARSGDAGAARSPWAIDAAWSSPAAYGPDSTFDVAMDGVAVAWTWEPDEGVYARSQDGAPHTTVSGERIVVTNVLVLEVRHTVSSIDTRSPEPVTTGDGDGVLHRDGLATLVHWSRPEATDPFAITTRDGLPVALAPGTTFVELTRAP